MTKRDASKRSGAWVGRLTVTGAVLFALGLLALRPNEVPPMAVAAQPAGNGGNTAHPFPGAKKAPSLRGGTEWLNTAGPLEVKDLKGKFVILDFWTYCCINCMHILPELKKLEHKYPNNLVVIGVHSAKFDEERETENIRAAILRYEIEHPVVNDADHKIWDAFRVNSWPTLRVIDPEGNLVAGNSGEISFEALDAFMSSALPYYREKKLLDETPLQFDIEKFGVRKTSPLFFPGKVVADAESDRLFIADSNHNRLVVTRLDGSEPVVIGSGEIGAADGSYDKASFNKPQGMHLVGQTLYVCDTENHLIRKVDLAAKTVSTIAGTGVQRRSFDWPGDRQNGYRGAPKTTELNSPWDVWRHGDLLYIAMAGPHQIWTMDLAETGIGPYAGNGREDIVDGRLISPQPYDEGFSSFAQPSGLTSDGEWLYVADSEGSSVRAVPFDPKKPVKTVVGTSQLSGGRLFAFGDVDGRNGKARMQHCLGVAYVNGQIYVTDTYNNKLKVIDVDKQTIASVAGDVKPGSSDDPPRFDEPAGISAAKGKLYIADTNNHAIRVYDVEKSSLSTLKIPGLEPPKEPEARVATQTGPAPIAVAKAKVKAENGAIALRVNLKLPEGFKLNPLAAPRYKVEASGDASALVPEGLGQSQKVEAPATGFVIPLKTAAPTGSATLRVTVTFYYCKEGSEGLCKAERAIWNVPVEWAADASAAEVELSYTAP